MSDFEMFDWYPAPDQWPKAEGQFRELGESDAVALLIADEHVFVGGRGTLQVNCNDIFYWACADCEPLPHPHCSDAFWDLWERVRKDPKWGSAVWCCLQRKMRPQKPAIEMMKAEGAWCDELEQLPVREDQ